MKTLRFFGMMLMAVVLSFGMSACGSDDDGGGSSSIVGEWVTVQSSSNYMDIVIINIQGGGTYRTTIYTMEGSNMNTEDPTVEHVYKYTASGTYKLDGNKIITDGSTEATYTLSSSGQTLYIKDVKGEQFAYQRMNAELRAYIAEIDKVAIPSTDH